MRGTRRRRILLSVVFLAMPRAVRSRALERERTAIEWRITGRPDGRQDVRQLVIEDGAASLIAGEERDPDLRLTMDGVDFFLLASGAALFVSGRVKVDGDPWLAARLPKLFGV